MDHQCWQVSQRPAKDPLRDGRLGGSLYAMFPKLDDSTARTLLSRPGIDVFCEFLFGFDVNQYLFHLMHLS
jgi:hypothetical protein